MMNLHEFFESKKMLFRTRQITLEKIVSKKRLIKTPSYNKIRSFYYMLGFYLKSSLPIIESLRLLQHDVKLAVIPEIIHAVQNGSCLADILKAQGMADEFMYSCLMLGENMGSYPEAFNQIVGYLEQKEENKKHLIRMASYPLLLVLLMFLLLCFVIFVITPQIYRTILGVGSSIPWSLKLFYQIYQFTIRHQTLLSFGILFAAGSVFFYRHSIRKHFARVMLKKRWTKSMFRMFWARNIVWQMEVLQGAGLSMVEILGIISRNSDEIGTRGMLEQMVIKLQQGLSLHESMSASAFFPEAVISYVRLGESTDSLQENLRSAVLYLNLKATDIAENTKRVIQPVLVLVAGGMVSLILALVLPIIQSITTMGGLS